MRKNPLALAAGLLAAALLALAPAPAQAAGEWQDGVSQSDTMINCYTGQPSTGVTANVGWWSPTGQVPRVGEKFYLRGYIGLVGLPCSSGTAVLPEILLQEDAFTFPDEPIAWGINAIDDATPTLTTSPVGVFRGVNGGIVLTHDVAGEEAFEIARGEVFEFQFPVIAKRELKGTATPAPTCYDRTAGDAPCPVASSGDHLQVAFVARGHGGDMNYVTPYVPLFAAAGTGTKPPATAGKAASTTTASYRVKGKKVKATVTVRSAKAPTGEVVVRDLAKKGKVVARKKLAASNKGVVKLKITKLRKGKHRLVAEYAGSSTVKPSAAAAKKVRLR